MTVSTDGSVMWWDIRRLNEPVESMPLREKGSDVSLGGVVLEYDPAAGPTNFMVGTEQVSFEGCVLLFDGLHTWLTGTFPRWSVTLLLGPPTS
jgi:hypothetical protein